MNANRRLAPRMKQSSESKGCVTEPADVRRPAVPEDSYSRSTRDRLVRLAYRFLWNRDDAEDVAQDAMATALERSGELRDADRWWSWVCRIVVHRCHEHGRRRLRRRRHEPAILCEAVRRAEDHGAVNHQDERDWLRALIDELPQRQREVIVLRHLQGMAFGQIAEVLGIKTATARVHAMAGRETLRSLILERNPTWFQGSPSETDKES